MPHSPDEPIVKSSVEARQGGGGFRSVEGEAPVVKPSVEARQGETGHGVNYVLIFSLGGAVILLGVAYLVFFG